MVNINKLKGKIVEKRYSVKTLANTIGLNKSTLYRKLSEEGVSITIKEADAIVRALSLSAEEANEIFFSQFVA